jgi:hypothetical protein
MDDRNELPTDDVMEYLTKHRMIGSIEDPMNCLIDDLVSDVTRFDNKHDQTMKR